MVPEVMITEEKLRESFGLAQGSEIHLPLGCTLTPAALQLLAERQIRVRYIDEQGCLYNPGGEGRAPERIHPLTGKTRDEEEENPSIRKSGDESGEALTHLDARTLVGKNHPRIALRGKIDTLIALTVLAQTDFDLDNRFPWLHPYLADIRSAIGTLLRAEVTGEEIAPVCLGGMSAETLHAVSHNPHKYLGHDHLLPEKSLGRNVAILNALRALAREVEIEIVRTFTGPDHLISRPDLLKAANRLSSALYVLMILTALAEQGIRVDLEHIVR
jgi:ethanolamine utilization cobalamin adenosyltransferase